ncbi:MAG TPA: MBOAT family O-acyltransferase [Gaiellaceae bacterium]|nr:MBOAT family O-acyltransferase [Gaiellaceae bacterium]
MLFNSYVFLFGFLPPVLVGCWALRVKNLRLLFLTLASWAFYAWWDWRFLPLMLSTTTVDYVAALMIHRTDVARRRNAWLIGSLAVNLGLLGYFKYADFFLNSLNGIGKAIGAPVGLPDLHILLPIGISFYTFNSMSYTIDVWRKRVEPTKHILEYSTFVALFPHLIAGPIVRFVDLQPQLRAPRPKLTSDAAGVGAYFFTCGLVKKLLLADQLSPHVDALFSHSSQLGFLGSWAAAVGYSLQLYFDFSGYSDMAVGLAWLIGFRFPQNFNSPYKAVNVSDFWRRWHMSLSAWFRDYLFIPLGGSRRGAKRTVVNLVVTMFLAGLWHGAAWTFVVWGLVHGLALGVHGVLKNLGLTPKSVIVNRVVTFLYVVAAFVIFRAPNLHVAGRILWRMLGTAGVESWSTLQTFMPGRFVVLLLALLVFAQFAPNTWELKLKPRLVYGLVTGVAAAVAVMSIAVPHPFIYFQF